MKELVPWNERTGLFGSVCNSMLHIFLWYAVNLSPYYLFGSATHLFENNHKYSFSSNQTNTARKCAHIFRQTTFQNQNLSIANNMIFHHNIT